MTVIEGYVFMPDSPKELVVKARVRRMFPESASIAHQALPATIAERLHWYALLVPPQKEFIAQRILHAKGLPTFVPVERKWRRKNKFTKTKELKTYALAPRYVFIGFRLGERLWFDLFNMHVISGVVGLHGVPKEIPNEAMVSLISRYANGLVAPDVQRFMRTRREFKAGDKVEIVEGPFAGHKVNVQEIVGSKATIVLELFGTEKNVSVGLDILEAV
jgi:transcription antitermination factor NusG